MIVCDGCERHYFAESGACPFCGTRARATVTAAVLSLALAACGPAVGSDSTTGAESTGTGSAMSSTTIMPATSTTVGMTSSSTTLDPDTTGVDPTTGTSTSAADESDDAPCAFYGCACCDFGPVGPLECDVWAQDCPQGEKCMPWANDGGQMWNATRCSPLDDSPVGIGETCTVQGSGVSGLDDCGLGAMCFGVDTSTNQGTCVAMCIGSMDVPTCADPGTACMIANDDVLILCLPTCDPKMPACADDEVCVPATDGSVCAPAS